MISVIDMPPPEESSWWRGKKGFEVGFFPSECVEVIGDKVPHTFKLSNASTKPVFRRHGKLIAFFRSFLLSRPSRRKLKQSGILKERVFGCDLGEHLLNTGRDIPMVLKCCAEFIEEYGIVDGIYRLSGVSSNIQRLRLAFDEDRSINLGDPSTVHDIHSVASLLKMYFRELPNPLLTYQLYDKFVSAVQSSEDVRLLRVRDVVQQLPPPHFRTLQYLLSHLTRVAAHGEETGMTPKNIAIVWAPNLLRSRDVENGGVGALHVVGVQAVLTEYLIRFSDLIFDEKVSLLSGSEQEGLLRARPKSLAISTPTKLLSLEEARARVLSTHLPPTQQKYIEVGGGPDKLPSKYHTVIDLPGKPGLPKLKKSPSGWKSFFSRGWYSGSTREKSRPTFRASRKASTSSLPHQSAYMQDKPVETDAPYNHRKKLRTVKSAESLAHCLKESSSHSTNKDDFPGEHSRKSSPQVSVDSSNSLELSPLSKSPGLQKHTRSSSHESYFESNSMDIISEPSFEEDEHGLFYYVSQQMKMLQDSSWNSEKDKKVDSVSMKSCEDLSVLNRTYSKEFSKSPPSLSEKFSRKQKLTSVEDFAQVKYQKLNEDFANNETRVFLDASPEEDYNQQFFRSNDYGWDDHNDKYQNCMQMNQEDLTLDPMEFYETAKNKRLSLVSSTDTENEPSDRTVVERYGNAETVLVEVHATQDSSSEEDQQYSPKAPLNLDSVFCSFGEPAIDSFDSGRVSGYKLRPLNSDETEIQELQFHLSDEEDVILPVTDIEHEVNPNETFTREIKEPDGSYSGLNLDEMDSSEPHLDDITVSLSPNDHLDLQNVPSQAENINDSSISKESERSSDVISTIQRSAVVQKDEVVTENLESFSIKMPPSPIYPPKSLKLQELQPLKTKIEIVPSHKKKLFNIPSPSSPVEEVRKKFELKASATSKNVEPSSEIKFRSRELPSKLVKTFEPSEPMAISQPLEVPYVDSQTKSSPPKESILLKRHSEPPPKQVSTSPPPGIFKRLSDKYEGENINKVSKGQSNSEKVTPKNNRNVQQPSLFTQLKIRKLQSLQAESSPINSEPVDPWSDPILDMQEDYHPIITYLPTKDSNQDEQSDSSIEEENEVDSLEKVTKHEIADDSLLACETESVNSVIPDDLKVVQVSPGNQSSNQNQVDKPCSVNEMDNFQLSSKVNEGSPESEAVRRERINRIKEERRAQLREKLKQESFRMEAEEKEKVQTKFRLRKENSKLSCIEGQDDVKKSDKAVETDSASITETGTTCDLDSSLESSRGTCVSPAAVISEISSGTDSGLESFSFSPKFPKNVSKDLSSEDCLRSQKFSGRKSARSYEDSRKWLSMPPTDIRDKVAMFERSKDTNELCRLGPNGKFPQKQGTSLASSFVR
ncbi:uncharacterized protein [Parasteatoda tepidariorum]|nr:uncharacterized protein LOC107451499 isoform X2 [Parasteatoda tepidariorum]